MRSAVMSGSFVSLLKNRPASSASAFNFNRLLALLHTVAWHRSMAVPKVHALKSLVLTRKTPPAGECFVKGTCGSGAAHTIDGEVHLIDRPTCVDALRKAGLIG